MKKMICVVTVLAVTIAQGDTIYVDTDACEPIPVGDDPYSVAIGDLDGVNGPDLAVANRDSFDVAVRPTSVHGTLHYCASKRLFPDACDSTKGHEISLAFAEVAGSYVLSCRHAISGLACAWRSCGSAACIVIHVLCEYSPESLPA